MVVLAFGKSVDVAVDPCNKYIWERYTEGSCGGSSAGGDGEREDPMVELVATVGIGLSKVVCERSGRSSISTIRRHTERVVLSEPSLDRTLYVDLEGASLTEVEVRSSVLMEEWSNWEASKAAISRRGWQKV